MTPEQFKLLGTLPGLYYARDQIQSQINMIELSILGSKITGTKKRGRPLGSKNKSQIEIQEPEVQRYDSIGRRITKVSKPKKDVDPKKSKLMSQKMKEMWANMSPEDRAKRRAKMDRGVKKAWKARKAKAKAQGL